MTATANTAIQPPPVVETRPSPSSLTKFEPGTVLGENQHAAIRSKKLHLRVPTRGGARPTAIGAEGLIRSYRGVGYVLEHPTD